MSSSVDTAVKTVWWMLLIRAILTLAFGIVALSSPGIALLALVFVFATYAILEGIAAVTLGIRSRGTAPHWGWSVFQGAVSILAGLLALIWPGATALTLLFLVAFWAIVLGVAEIGQAFVARKRGEDTWGWTVAAGALNIIVGILLLVWPATGILTLLWLIGVFAVATGIVGIIWAFRARTTGPEAGSAAAPGAGSGAAPAGPA